MGASDYVKADAVGFGQAVGNLISAVRGDGVGADDFDELIATMTSAAKAVNEMRDVPEAAAEHILGASGAHPGGGGGYARGCGARASNCRRRRLSSPPGARCRSVWCAASYGRAPLPLSKGAGSK